MSCYDDLLALIEVPGDDCIVWPYSTDKDGYGKVWVPGVGTLPAHRVALSTVSDPPAPEHHAAHGPCHNRRCINQRHLSWKTPKENAADKLRDGTDVNGEANGRCKLSTVQVDEIRALYDGPQPRWWPKTGPTLAELGAEYGVSKNQIHRIINGKNRRIS